MTIETRPLTNPKLKSLAARIDRPVVLVGLMGAGKTTIGRKIAQLLDLPFSDADDEIEKAAQMKVTEIFERYGEDHFRDGERRVIARLLEGGPGILATGGGAFIQPSTRALILERGVAIWLDSEVSTLVDRVGRKDTRPLLRGGDRKDILTRLKAERDPFYAQAHIKIMSDAGPHAETVDNILWGISEWL